MFKFAQSIVRHKVGVIAVIAFAVVLFSRDGQDQQAKPSSPWAAQSEPTPSFAAKKEEDGLVSGMVGKAATAASDYLGEATGINPAELKENTVDNWNNTADAMKKANER